MQAGQSIRFRINVWLLAMMEKESSTFLSLVAKFLELWRPQMETWRESWRSLGLQADFWWGFGNLCRFLGRPRFISMHSCSHIFTDSLQGSFIPLKSNTRIPPRHPCRIWSDWATQCALSRYCNRYTKAYCGFRCHINSLSKGNWWISTFAELESLLMVNERE